MKKEGKEFRKQFKAWLKAEVKKKKYTDVNDACLRITQDVLKRKHSNTVLNYLYGQTFPIPERNARLLNRLTKIKMVLMIPDYK